MGSETARVAMAQGIGSGLRAARAQRMAVQAICLACLGLLTAFVLAVVGACVWYVPGATFLRTLFSEEILFAIRLSLATTTASTAAAMLLGIPAAYALSRYRFPGASILDTILDLPMVFPAVASGFALLLLFGYYFGDTLAAHGWRVPHTQHGIAVAQFFCALTIAVRTVKAAFDSIQPRLPAVARTLGSREWHVFRRVMFPLARNGILAGAIMTWSYALGLFGPVMMFCGATRMRTEVLPVSVYLNTAVGDLEEAAAATIILLVIAVGSLLLFRRLGGRGYLF